MNALAFTLSCPHCGASMDLLASSTCRGVATSAMVKCSAPRCRREALVRVCLEPTPRPESLRRRERAA